MSRVLIVFRRPLHKARGWWGDSERHSEAAKKGWLKRKRPPELYLSSEQEYREWFLRNIAGLSIVNEESGLPILFDAGDVEHAITEGTDDGARRFSLSRARRLPWLPIVARYGSLKVRPGTSGKRPWAVAVFSVPREGAHAMVVEYDPQRRACWFVTHFPIGPDKAKRIRLNWPDFRPPAKENAPR